MISKMYDSSESTLRAQTGSFESNVLYYPVVEKPL